MNGANMKPEIVIDPDLDWTDFHSEGYYAMRADCSNCNKSGVLVFLKEGTVKPNTPIVCPNCKCETLEFI